MFKNSFSLLLLLSLVLFCLSGCEDSKDPDTIVFATSAEYPPFEYRVRGELTGFDVELAQLIAKQLGKKVQFKDVQFSAVLPTLQSGNADAAIATITVTDERRKNFAFSIPYYVESMAIIFNKKTPLKIKGDLVNKKIACQLGTTMEIWLKENAQDTEIIAMDTNPQAVEALKAGHVHGVLIDAVQANAFTTKNPSLGYEMFAQADEGYGVAFNKGSPLVDQVNKAIQTIVSNGEMKKLEKQYLEIQ